MTLQRPLTLPVAMPRGPQHYWKMMQELSAKKGFTIADIALCSEGVAYSTVKDYARFLLADGYIVKIGTRKAGYAIADVYRIKKASRSAPTKRRADYAGKRGAVQAALWNAMRTLATFTIPELAATASTEEHPVKPRTAETYVRRLVKAGAVEIVEPYRKGAPGATGARRGVWRLARAANTGPLPLKVFDARVVFDPNKNRVLGEAVVTEARA